MVRGGSGGGVGRKEPSGSCPAGDCPETGKLKQFEVVLEFE